MVLFEDNMKKILLPFLLFAGLASAQLTGTLQSINQGTLAAATDAVQTQMVFGANFTAASPLGAVAVANGINTRSLYNFSGVGNGVSTMAYIVDPGTVKGELIEIMSAVATSNYKVRRTSGGSGSKATSHVNGASVFFGNPNAFYTFDPSGACPATQPSIPEWNDVNYTNMAINVSTGSMWICSTITRTWVPNFSNPFGEAYSVSLAVASAAGLITPSGPLFHVTGTAAVTGFNIPLGFVTGSFTIIPDGAFTTTTANNIALASTAVTSKPLTFTFDFNSGKFYPSY
jgi:hypothetical protein